MLLTDLIKFTVNTLKSQALRVLLIILAMAIGVTSVTVLVSLGESTRSYIVNEFESLGTHLIIVLPGRTETTGGTPPLFGETPRELTLEDSTAFLRSPYIAAVAPLTTGMAPVTFNGLERETNVFGSTHELLKVRHLSLAQGNFLPLAQTDLSQSVCVIGQTIKNELFKDHKALGQWLRINDRRFLVIGVLASEGQSIGVDFDEMVIIPVASAQALFNTQSLFRVLVETKSKQAIPQAINDIREIIKLRHEGEDDVTIITQDSVVTAFNKILLALTFAVACISGISLIVAGILVMNIMLVAVAQRTAEVGLLKALGATQSQIQYLFLMEAVLLSIAGAAIGIAAGLGIIAALREVYPKFPIHVPEWGLAAAVLVALITGLVFGVLPARKAARLDPIAALTKR